MIDLSQLSKAILSTFENQLCRDRYKQIHLDEETIDRLIDSMKHHLSDKERLFGIIRERYHNGEKSIYDYPSGCPRKTTVVRENKQLEFEIEQPEEKSYDDLEDYVEENAPSINPSTQPQTVPSKLNLNSSTSNAPSNSRSHYQSDYSELSVKSEQQEQDVRYKEQGPQNKQTFGKAAQLTASKNKYQSMGMKVEHQSAKQKKQITNYTIFQEDLKPLQSIKELQKSKAKMEPIKEKTELKKAQVLNLQNLQDQDLDIQCDKLHELECKYSEECREISRNQASFHITGLYNDRTSKHHTKTSSDRMNFQVLLLKSSNQPTEILLYDYKMNMAYGELKERLGTNPKSDAEEEEEVLQDSEKEESSDKEKGNHKEKHDDSWSDDEN